MVKQIRNNKHLNQLCIRKLLTFTKVAFPEAVTTENTSLKFIPPPGPKPFALCHSHCFLIELP